MFGLKIKSEISTFHEFLIQRGSGGCGVSVVHSKRDPRAPGGPRISPAPPSAPPPGLPLGTPLGSLGSPPGFLWGPRFGIHVFILWPRLKGQDGIQIASKSILAGFPSRSSFGIVFWHHLLIDIGFENR